MVWSKSVRKFRSYVTFYIPPSQLRVSAFEAGYAQLYLDILDMDRGHLKMQALNCLEMLCQDPLVQVFSCFEKRLALLRVIDRVMKELEICADEASENG